MSLSSASSHHQQNSHASKLKKTKSKSKFKIFFRNKINTLRQGVLEKPKQLDELEYPGDYVSEIPFLKDIYESYTEVYKPVKRLSKSQLETKRNLHLCSQCLEHSGDAIIQGDMTHLAQFFEKLGQLYDEHCDDLQQVVNDMEVLSTNALRVMNTRADYKQSLIQHNFKKKQYEQIKNATQCVTSTTSASVAQDNMQKRARAEDDMYAAERFMDASYEDVMAQIRWLKDEANVKYPNTLKKLCRSYRTLFEQGLAQIQQIEEHLNLEDESHITEPAETRRGLEVLRRNLGAGGNGASGVGTSSTAQNAALMKECKIFGAPLDEIMARPEEADHEIPALVEQIIEYIEENLDTEGIFRIPASTSKLNEYIKRADLGMPLHLENEHIPHNVCGLLKKYLRMLPDSLLTHGLYDDFVELMHVEDDERTMLLEDLFLQLPLHNQKLLLRILLLMRRVIEHCEHNKMNQNNTVVVFAPNILYIDDENPLRVAQSTPQIVYVTNLLLKNYDLLVQVSERTYGAGESSTEPAAADDSNTATEDYSTSSTTTTFKRTPPPVPKKFVSTTALHPHASAPEESQSDFTSTCTEQTPQTTESGTTGSSSFFTSTTSTQFAPGSDATGNDYSSSVNSSYDSTVSKSRRSGLRFRTYNFDEEQLRASLENASLLSSHSTGSSSPDEESHLQRRISRSARAGVRFDSLDHVSTSPPERYEEEEDEAFIETALPADFQGTVDENQVEQPVNESDSAISSLLSPQGEIDDDDDDFPGVQVTGNTEDVDAPDTVDQDEDLLRFE